LIINVSFFASLLVGYRTETPITMVTANKTTDVSQTTSTTTELKSPMTFGEIAKTGETTYYACVTCHGFNWVTDYGRNIFRYYWNANNLLNQIDGHRSCHGDAAIEVLSFILLEQGWVSADTVFDRDTLWEILFTP
jgi:hypothetical protein